MADSDLYVGREPVMFDFEGAPVVIGPNTVVRAGHPIMKGREDLFVPVTVHFDVARPEPQAADDNPATNTPEKRALRTR